jgi:hypothetical protein
LGLRIRKNHLILLIFIAVKKKYIFIKSGFCYTEQIEGKDGLEYYLSLKEEERTYKKYFIYYYFYKIL